MPISWSILVPRWCYIDKIGVERKSFRLSDIFTITHEDLNIL